MIKMKLDHIGVVVNDIEHSQEYYTRMFDCRPLSKIIYEPAHKVHVLFLDVGHGSSPMIELIMPAAEDSRVSAYLKKTGGGIHHLAYEVPDIDEAVRHFKSSKAMIIGGIVPGAGHDNTRTVWLYTVEKELVELIEQRHD